MKKFYIKPITEFTNVIENYGIMESNSEPEITYNIGAKENPWFDFDWDDNNEFGDLWSEDENEDI